MSLRWRPVLLRRMTAPPLWRARLAVQPKRLALRPWAWTLCRREPEPPQQRWTMHRKGRMRAPTTLVVAPGLERW